MEQNDFLELHVFAGLTDLNDGFDVREIKYFSETDFEEVLKRVEHFGIGIYGIEPWLNGELFGVAVHEEHKKKATDARWYNKAFKTFRMKQKGLVYAASYKVSPKLLARG